MEYFDGVEFVTYGDCPEHDWMIRGKMCLDSYGIQYKHSGTLYLSVDGGPEKVCHGPCVFFTMPGRIYSYGCVAPEHRHHCYICFRGERAERMVSGGLFDPSEPMPLRQVQDPDRFLRTMTGLQELLRGPAGYRTATKVHMLEDLLLQIEEPSGSSGGYYEERLRKLCQEVAENPGSPWDFDAVASDFAVSSAHFRRIFRAYSGMPPTAYLIGCRINLARTLLVTTDLMSSDVAHRCGYADEFFFYRLFRRRTGFSPQGYRKEFKLR
ncbi:MAG: AraC family transcriptional regulator [Victivallaceae bacterium]|nr:AraC family transcriptional regulator [Victivallaceae bacterium]